MDSESSRKILERYDHYHREWRFIRERCLHLLVLALAWLGAAYALRPQELSSSWAVSIQFLLMLVGIAAGGFNAWRALRLDKHAYELSNHLANVMVVESEYPAELFERLAIARRPTDAVPVSSIAWAIMIAAGTLLASQLLKIFA